MGNDSNDALVNVSNDSSNTARFVSNEWDILHTSYINLCKCIPCSYSDNQVQLSILHLCVYVFDLVWKLMSVWLDCYFVLMFAFHCTNINILYTGE